MSYQHFPCTTIRPSPRNDLDATLAEFARTEGLANEQWKTMKEAIRGALKCRVSHCSLNLL